MEYNCPEIVQAQKDFFKSRHTQDISYRKKSLKKLLKEVKKREKDICNALYADFKKSEFESVISETSIIISELKLAIRKLKSW